MPSVRHATEEDLPSLVDLGRAMHDEAPTMRHTAYDPGKVDRVLRAAMDSGVVFVHIDAAGHIDGAFAGLLGERWFSPDPLFTDLGLFVRPDRRGGLAAYRLLTSVIEWCKAKGLAPEDVMLGVSTGVAPEQTGRLFEQMGFVRVGGIYLLGAY